MQPVEARQAIARQPRAAPRRVSRKARSRLLSFVRFEKVQLAASRRTQSSTVTASHAPPIPSSTRAVGWPPSHLPAIAEAKAHGAASNVIANKTVPPPLAARADRIFPRAACAHEVVMPHVGQRQPVRRANPQADRPNCSCVPNPRGSGFNPRAVAIRTSAATPHAASNSLPRWVRALESFTELPRGVAANGPEGSNWGWWVQG